MLDKIKFINEIETQGFSIVRNAITKEYIDLAKQKLVEAISKEEEFHKGKDFTDYAMVLLCPLYDKIFAELFDFPIVHEPINAILGEGSITYAHTSSSMPPESTNYSNRIHTDCPRIIPGYITNLGATILLDDFTEENGATWFLPNSQKQINEPSTEEFYSNAKRLIEKAGTIWFFNARIWHAGGDNKTDKWRHALTINMVRPWMKQRIDIPRALEEIDTSNYSEIAKQKLGFYAQIPSNYDEYYVPYEHRKFKQETV